MDLFTPCKIGSMELKNKLVMAPISSNLGKDGFVTERMVRFFEERAKGGVGLIVIGDGIVDAPLGNNVKENTLIDDDKYVPALIKLTDAVSVYGAKIVLQLSHAGRRAGRVSNKGRLDVTDGKIPVAPSPIPHPVPGYVVPTELSQGEIQMLVQKFRSASRRTIDAGFDGIGLHCAHMYLCGQFLSPWANRRTDAYGGNFEKRLRFVLEIIDGIKREVGEKYPLIVRMNGEEPEGGNTLKDIAEIARRFEKAGVDAIHVSTGFGVPIKKPGFIPSVTPMRFDDGCIVHLAENIRQRVSIPVIAVNKIKDVHTAEKILQEKKADLIAMARPLVADPELPSKAIEGRHQEIRPCIYCCRCFQSVIEKDASLECSTNPLVGREAENVLKAPQRPLGKKKVLVVGAGPAGMQAALTSAKRGHKVFLLEKEDQMGGQLRLASRPPGKEEIDRFTNYLTDQIKQSNVQVKLGQEVNLNLLYQIKPDVAILATGSRPVMPDITGFSEANILFAGEILQGTPISGKKVVVLGGGRVGCEVAEFLAEKGKDLVLIEILDDLARYIPHLMQLDHVMALERLGVRIMTRAKVTSLSDNELTVQCKGEKKVLEVDGVVIAVGSKPYADDMDRLIQENVPEVYKIGDRSKVRAILEAVRSGFEVASGI